MPEKSVKNTYYGDKEEFIVPYVENTEENEEEIMQIHTKQDNEDHRVKVAIPLYKRLPIFDFLFTFTCCSVVIAHECLLYFIMALYFIQHHYILGIITASVHTGGLLLSATIRLDSMSYTTPWRSKYYINLVRMLFSVGVLITGCRLLRESLTQHKFRDKYSTMFCSEKKSTELSLLCFTIVLFQSAPQIILQIVAYNMIHKINDKGILHFFLEYGILYYIFLTVHLIPLAATTALPIRINRKYKLHTPRCVDLFRSIMKYYAHLSHTMSRTVVFFGITKVIGWWMAVICGFQWLIMYTLFLTLYTHQIWFMYNDNHIWDSALFKPFIAIFYLFTFVHPHRDYMIHTYGIYLLMNILINLSVLYMLYSINEDSAFLAYPYKSVCYFLMSLTLQFLIMCLDGVYDLL